MNEDLKIIQESIDRMVRESVEQNMKDEKALSMMVENAFNQQINNLLMEKSTPSAPAKKKKGTGNKKRSVIQWLNKPSVNTAEIRRQMEGEPTSQEEEDAKRSYFMKKVNQSHGKDFTDDEVNTLYAIKSKLGQ